MKYLPSLNWYAVLLCFLLGAGVGFTQVLNAQTTLRMYDGFRREDVRVGDPTVLQALSLGYPGFMADLEWLSFVQHVGKTVTSRGFEDDIAPFMDTITTLDPQFALPYTLSLLLLDDYSPEQARQLGERGIAALCSPEAVQAVLSHSFDRMPEFSYTDICRGHHELPSLLGLLLFDRFDDPLLAAKYYYIAAHTAGASASAERYVALMLSNAQHREVAIALWKNLYEQASTGVLREYAAKKLMREHNLYQLELAYQQFVAAQGYTPETPDALVEQGYISEDILEDPFTTAEDVFTYFFDEQGTASAKRSSN